MYCKPSIPDIGLGGLVSPPYIPIPVIRPIPFTDDDVGDFSRFGPYMGPLGLFSAATTVVWPPSAHDTTDAAHGKSYTRAVDAGLLLAWLSGRPSSPHHPLLARQFEYFRT